MAYTTAANVKLIACCEAEDLKKTTGEFDALLAKLISWADAEINAYMRRAYTAAQLAADTVLAATLESVSTQAVDNWLQSTVQRMNSPIITINDFVVKSPPRLILTKDMKESLDCYSAKGLAVPAYTAGEVRFSGEVTGLFDNSEVVSDELS